MYIPSGDFEYSVDKNFFIFNAQKNLRRHSCEPPRDTVSERKQALKLFASNDYEKRFRVTRHSRTQEATLSGVGTR